MHASRPHTAGKLCPPQIRGIRVIRGCLLLLLFVSIRGHLPKSGAKSPHSVKDRGSHGAFTLQSSSRAIGEIRVIGGSLENRKKFSLNPVEGISTSDLNVYK
jgi:hypothetical protein